MGFVSTLKEGFVVVVALNGALRRFEEFRQRGGRESERVYHHEDGDAPVVDGDFGNRTRRFSAVEQLNSAFYDVGADRSVPSSLR